MSYLDVLLGGIKTIQNNGSNLAAEPTLNIVGATSIVDDSANKRTTVTLGTGITQLSGDVTAGPGSGSVAATVVKANGATVPAAGALTTGNVLQVSGASALSYGPVNLAGGSNYISGTLPTGNQAAQTLGGALSGTTASAAIVPGTNGQIAVTLSSAFAWTSLISLETTHGRFTAGGSGSDFKITIGPTPGAETATASVWALSSGGSPTSTNHIIQSDDVNCIFNAPSASGNVDIAAAGSTGFIFNVLASVLNSLATLTIQHNSATIQTLSSAIGTELANLSQPAAGTGPRLYGSSGKLGIVDSSGGLTLLPGP